MALTPPSTLEAAALANTTGLMAVLGISLNKPPTAPLYPLAACSVVATSANACAVSPIPYNLFIFQ